MAFSPSTFSLLVDSFGGRLIRLWGYGTRDSRTTVTASGYVTGASQIGIRVGDLVLVVEWDAAEIHSSAYTTRVAAIVNDAASLVYDDNYLQEFASIADFEAAYISGSIETARVNGYSAAGDCPSMLLVRVSSEPTHDGKFQSGDGAWWEFARGQSIDLRWFGAVGDDAYSAADVTKAENWATLQTAYNSSPTEANLNAWLTPNSVAVRKWLHTAALYGVQATASPGNYRVFGVIVEPGAYNVDVLCAPGVRFRSVPVDEAGMTRPMINIDSNVGTAENRPTIKWVGGFFWADGLPYGNPEGDPWNQGGGGARGGCLGFTRYKYWHIEDVRFKGGTGYFDADGTYATPGLVAGDQGLTTIQCKSGMMINCHGEDLPDALFYPRANADMADPEDDSDIGVIYVVASSAKRCYKGLYPKFSGARLIVQGFETQDCWTSILADGDYTPQYDSEGNLEGGTGYQPFDIIINGLRAERTASRVIEISRAQVASVSDVVVSDWGRRGDGEASVTSGRSYVPAVMFAGCQNFGLSNMHARLRDWDGGNSTLHTAPFLEGVLIESQTHTDDDDPTSEDPPATNTLISKTGILTNISIEGIPIDVVDGVGVEVVDTARRGTGALVRVRGADEATIKISGWAAPNVAAASQTFIFNSTNAQFIDGTLVPSPEGSGWTPGAEFTFTTTIAAGVITIPTQLRAQCLTVSVDTQSAASSDDLDTISGSFAGQQITIRRETTGRSVVLKNGTGNLSIGGDITIAAVDDFVVLSRRGNTWYLVYSNI